MGRIQFRACLSAILASVEPATDGPAGDTATNGPENSETQAAQKNSRARGGHAKAYAKPCTQGAKCSPASKRAEGPSLGLSTMRALRGEDVFDCQRCAEKNQS